MVRLAATVRAVAACAIVVTAGPAHGEAGEAGAFPVLVQASVPLTPDVADAISAYAAHVSFIWPEIDAMAISVTAKGMAGLVADPRVAVVERDEAVAMDPSAAPADAADLAISAGATPWNLDMIDALDTGYDGTGVTVALIDTGLPPDYADYIPADRIDTVHAAGFAPEGGGSGLSGIHQQVYAPGGWYGLHYHGLTLASIVTGFANAFWPFPVRGAAPGATILPIRAFNKNAFGYYSWIAASVLYVAYLKRSGILPGPVVILYAAGGLGYSAVYRAAWSRAVADGVAFVTLAGEPNGPNPLEPPRAIWYPGRFPDAITVAAAGWTREGQGGLLAWLFDDVPEADAGLANEVYVATYSSREPFDVDPGSQIDVLAPSNFIPAAALVFHGYADGVQRSSHESFTPGMLWGGSAGVAHVTAVVAQMLQKNPTLRQAEVKAILRASALPIPENATGVTTPLQPSELFPVGPVAPWDDRSKGAGLVQAKAALALTPAP